MIMSQSATNIIGCMALQVYLFNINGYIIASAYMFPEDDTYSVTEGL